MHNLWHTHEDGFRGTHTHQIDGSNVEHTHAGPPELEVVELFGKRFKQPAAPIAPDATNTVLEVDDAGQPQTSEHIEAG